MLLYLIPNIQNDGICFFTLIDQFLPVVSSGALIDALSGFIFLENLEMNLHFCYGGVVYRGSAIPDALIFTADDVFSPFLNGRFCA